jgi:glycosidase
MAEDFVFGPAESTAAVVEARKTALAGFSHAHRLDPRDPLPGEPVVVRATAGPDVDAEPIWVYFTTDGSAPAGADGVATSGSAVPMTLTGVVWDDLVWGFVSHLEATIPGQPEGTLVRYVIDVHGTLADGGEGSATRTDYFAYAVDSWNAPEWLRDAVMYYVMPDRFFPGSDRDWIQTDDTSRPMGGTLRGIREKLDYIQGMGFNALWLMPWMTGPTYHKYGTTDFFGVDPDFGTEQDLRDLIEDAHARGMRVLVDFVGNHVSDEHPIFVEAKADPTSAYRTWFDIHDDGDYLSFFGGGELPHIQHNDPDARRYILDVARAWVTDYGIDGYDLDYAVGPAHEFWAEFSRAVREVGDDVAIFTEGVTTPESLLSYVGRVDGCQDFAWCQAARRTFGNGKLDVARFERFLSGSERFFPSGFVAPIMIDNQNMDRFLLVAGNDQRRLRVAATCQYSISQPISVWAGTEMGMSQRRSAATDLNHVRDATAWDDMDEQTVAHFRALGALRAAHPALARGERVPLIADAQTGVLAYRKQLAADQVTVVLNASDEPRVVEVPAAAPVVDALDGRGVTVTGGTATVRLAPWTSALLVSTP